MPNLLLQSNGVGIDAVMMHTFFGGDDARNASTTQRGSSWLDASIPGGAAILPAAKKSSRWGDPPPLPWGDPPRNSQTTPQ